MNFAGLGSPSSKRKRRQHERPTAIRGDPLEPTKTATARTYRTLAALLKSLLRGFGFRCVSVQEVPTDDGNRGGEPQCGLGGEVARAADPNFVGHPCRHCADASRDSVSSLLMCGFGLCLSRSRSSRANTRVVGLLGPQTRSDASSSMMSRDNGRSLSFFGILLIASI